MALLADGGVVVAPRSVLSSERSNRIDFTVGAASAWCLLRLNGGLRRRSGVSIGAVEAAGAVAAVSSATVGVTGAAATSSVPAAGSAHSVASATLGSNN